MIEYENHEELAAWLGTGSVNFFGMPFSGKDSQAKRLNSHFDGNILGGGDILRNSAIPPEVKTIMDAGKLIPTQDYINIVLPYLSKEEFANKPLFLSAVGRWKGEENSVKAALEQAHHPLKMVVHLALDVAQAQKRLESEDIREHRGSRIDDDTEVLKHRIEEFQTKTLPVIKHYDDMGLLVEIDANLPKDEVELQVLGALAIRAGVNINARIVEEAN